jgi:hypothetical protein
MIANVTISFKYIGGSTLLSPINKLQNALSFNFFANTQVYDRRADTIVEGSDKTKSLFDLLLGKPQITKEDLNSITTITTADGVDSKQIEAAEKQDNDAANNTPSQPTDLDNLVIKYLTSFSGDVEVELTDVSGTLITAKLGLKNENQKLTKDYDVIDLKITNINNPNETYTAPANFSSRSGEEFCKKSNNAFIDGICREKLTNANIIGNVSNGFLMTVSTTGTSQTINGLAVNDNKYVVIKPALINTGLTVGQTYKFEYTIKDLGTLSETRTIGSTATTITTTGTTVPQSAGDPKVTGFEIINQNFKLDFGLNSTCGFDAGDLELTLKIKTENIFSGDTKNLIISEDKLKEIVNKGIKFQLTSPTTSSFVVEDIVLFDDRLKGIKAETFYFGKEKDPFTNFPIIKCIKKGNHNMSLTYNGQKIQTIPFIVGDTGGEEESDFKVLKQLSIVSYRNDFAPDWSEDEDSFRFNFGFSAKVGSENLSIKADKTYRGKIQLVNSTTKEVLEFAKVFIYRNGGVGEESVVIGAEGTEGRETLVVSKKNLFNINQQGTIVELTINWKTSSDEAAKLLKKYQDAFRESGWSLQLSWNGVEGYSNIGYSANFAK